MFAVPGWNLSAPLKAQTEAAPAANGAAGAATAPSKKRKRGRDKKTGANAAPLVTEDNVADMYARHIDGLKPAPRPQVQAQAQEKAKDVKAEEKKKGKVDGKQKNKKQRRESEGGEKGEDDKAKAPKKVQQQEEEEEEDKGDDAAVAPPKAKKQKKDKKANNTVATPAAPPPAPLPTPNTKLTPLQAKMREKLAAARFRHLNETLYTTPSAHAAQLVASDPSVFSEYHAGFRQQVAVWPENPVDGFVALVRARAKVRENWRDRRRGGKQGGNKKGGGDADSDDDGPPPPAALKPLPRTHGTCTLADLGCGDAALATQLTPQAAKLHLKLHSFDLASPSPLVTTADIANLPLSSNSVDVAIFCLALMGTNWLDFIDEAYRVLRWRGELWVAEIKSRFGRSPHQPHKPGEAVAHSVGKRQKKKAAAAATSKAGKQAAAAAEDAANDAAQAAAEAELDGDLGGAAPTPAGQETDVSAFVAALRRRGFVLDAPPERPQDAVDLGNKMFVRMRFVKGLPALRGKNVGVGADGEKKGSQPQQQQQRKAGKFTAVKEDEEADDEADARVLKPCVYKLR